MIDDNSNHKMDGQRDRRSRVTDAQRDRHSKWAFGELRQFLTYKAKNEGVPLRVIKPKCQYLDKKNRNKNQFECLQCRYKHQHG